jgi:hypothetical protein
MPGGPTFDEAQLLHLTDRDAWRSWLQRHYRSAREAWLVSYKVHTGKPSISYNDQVEEALCFGWIDSIGRRIDDDRFVRHFTPRRPGSPYSEANKARLRALVRDGRVAPDVLAGLGEVLGGRGCSRLRHRDPRRHRGCAQSEPAGMGETPKLLSRVCPDPHRLHRGCSEPSQ